MPLFSPPSNLSPCLPRSLSLASLGSPEEEHSGSVRWAPQCTQSSQHSILSVPLPPTHRSQATMFAAPLALPPHEPSTVLCTDQALWALLQKLPTRDDLDLVATRMEMALRREITGIKQEVSEMNARVSSLETSTTSLCQDVSGLQDTHDEFTNQFVQLQLLIDELQRAWRRGHIDFDGAQITLLPDISRRIP